MSTTELERFTADLRSDAGLAEEFTSLGDDPEAWVRWASAKGYRLSLEEATGLSSSYSELPDEDLEKVAGGWSGDPPGG